MSAPTPSHRNRRSAYSVAETARLCGISRSRFYELIEAGVMPMPVYCVRSRRPLFTQELAAQCVEIRESNLALDGRYVVFYERRNPPASTTNPAPASQRRRTPSIDPLAQEMIESLRSMGITESETAMAEAIRECCPNGVTEERFEQDLLLIFGDLRRRDRVQESPGSRQQTAG